MGKDQFLFGRNILEEALQAKAPLSKIFYENEASLAFARDLQKKYPSLKSVQIVKGLPSEISSQHGHQGIAFQTSHNFYEMNWDIEKNKYPFVLLCNHLEDVQNLGALTRAAAAFGVGLIVHEERRSVRLNAAAVKISAGQAFRMKFLEVSNLQPLCRKLADAGYYVVGLDADEEAAELFEWKPQFPLALVLGSESAGLSKPVKGQIETLLRIPMAKNVESLNAAHAASISMAWIFRELACAARSD